MKNAPSMEKILSKSSGRHTGQSVLVVDDEVSLCFLIKNFLNRMNYNVYCEHTLEGAKNSYMNKKPSLILLDVHLPDGLGTDLLEIVRRDDSETTVIIISSEKELGEKISKADAFLQKPFQLSDVKKAILEMS